ncbi:hypothetical protein [Desulfoplanes formicivorans]|uniref:Uncharacterized protein n=1 Tax=Desulfoplanes formicivorans TaxID=1592317 RepID=A0A194AJF7_9BACT|nr:hypothetical protein [Desulfoplanes formicivorans]GAU08879.1 hypothetical protein DPF_1596 [Desulfoplanes formicivorans]
MDNESDKEKLKKLLILLGIFLSPFLVSSFLGIESRKIENPNDTGLFYEEFENKGLKKENTRHRRLSIEDNSYPYSNNNDLSKKDVIDKLTTYAVILGRASGCGIDTQYESHRVGKWIDRQFPPGSAEHKTYLSIYISGTAFHAREQAMGNSPDTCQEVSRALARIHLP